MNLFQQALDELNKAIQADPTNYDVYIERGWLMSASRMSFTL